MFGEQLWRFVQWLGFWNLYVAVCGTFIACWFGFCVRNLPWVERRYRAAAAREQRQRRARTISSSCFSLVSY